MDRPQIIDSTPSTTRLGRRSFLVGAAGAMAAGLAACGSGGSDGGADESEIEPGTFTLAQRFPNSVLVPGEVRLPHSLFRNAEFVNDGPDRLGAQVVDVDGNPMGERLLAPRFDVTPAAYYVWRPTIEAPGVYALVVDGGPAEGASFQVFDPETVTVPLVGGVLDGFDTPTVDDSRGVDPVCTRDPICPFHDLTLTEALADGRGVAYLVGTPAFCQTGTCAPALEAMITVADDYADRFVFVHAEVFTDLTATTIAPAVDAASLDYEPAIFITAPDGEIVDRLDAIWGEQELRERLTLAQP